MERHFACTACGKCCVGMLPLLLEEAIELAGRVPLALVWTVVRPNSASFDLSARIGTTVKVARRREVAVQVTPMAYLPERLPCPELGPDNLCGIHDRKPLRCRTMPFYPYQDEREQGELLVPRAGWACDVSREAPLVYRDGQILDRAAFDEERRRLEEQARIIKPYANNLVARTGTLVRDLEVLSKRPNGGRLALSFSGILPRLPQVGSRDFAEAQLPVLRHYADVTANEPAMKSFHQHYLASARGLELTLSSGA